MIRIGIDFDNTLVCYDEIFHALALAHNYVPNSILPGKQAVRDHMRANGQEGRWREFQGEVYGQRMTEAEEFPHALDFIRQCDERGVEYAIVSHKTARPAAGPPHDLHAAARKWLRRHAVAGPRHVGTFFEPTRQEKLDRIRTLACDYFIDDLPEFLTSPGFPDSVERLLFDPLDTCPEDPRYQRFRSWKDIEGFIFGKIQDGVGPALEKPDVWALHLLDAAGLGALSRVTSVPGGANNQVFCVETSDKKYILKKYFSDSDDDRDRLGAEYAFALFAADLGIAALPRPVAIDRDTNAALYTYSDGEPFADQVPDKFHIDQAMEFLAALNKGKDVAGELPDASEACFSVASHIKTVDQRLRNLATQVADKKASDFIRSDLLPAWSQIAAEAKLAAGMHVFEEIGTADRCVSPSDFGFHNALIDKNGRITFVDFEYAGWDDPARTVCDFFCQVSVPVPRKFLPEVAGRVSALVNSKAWFYDRLRLLMPVYQIKWCSILLNDFMSTGRRRREFAGRHHGTKKRTSEQLEKARLMLSSISKTNPAIAAG